jgi:RNA polymerase sigma-70 factor (ECF subfamily)
MEIADGKLIENFLAGDDSAFEPLLKKYLKPIYNFIYQLTSDRSALDDLTQVTFIKAWKNIRRFDQTKSFKVWLFAIAKNTAYDYLKKKKTVSFSNFLNDEGYNKLDEIEEDKILPDEIMDKKNLIDELDKKLKELPKNYRLMLLMCYKDDLTLSDISEILEVPYNTIKSQHARALLSLRKAYFGVELK